MDSKKIERTKNWLRYSKSFEKIGPRTFIYVSLFVILGVTFQFELEYLGGMISFILLYFALTDLMSSVTFIICTFILKKHDKEYYYKYIYEDDDMVFGRDTHVK